MGKVKRTHRGRQDNVRPQTAQKYAEEMAELLFRDHECVIATHTDTKTVHSHIIVNSVDESFFDMSTDYFGKWFSDYVYVKNLSEKEIVFIDAGKQKIVLEPDAAMAFYFGSFYASNAEDFEKREFIEQLGILKDGLGWDMEENYANLWNACADYDNNHRGLYLTDRIQAYDFVDDEILEYIVKEQSLGGVSRLRYFIGDTYDANLYRLDGYGNLANVDNSDFEYLINDIVQSLEEDITPPFYKEQACL